MRRAILTTAFLALVTPPAQAASVYDVVADDVYVRNKVKGVVIGTAYAGEQVVIQGRQGNWGFGALRGSFTGVAGRPCGWVELNDGGHRYLRRTGDRAPSGCPAYLPELREQNLFEPGSYFRRIGRGAVWMARVAPCFDPTAYGNYNVAARTFSHPYGAMPIGRGFDAEDFGMRYRTRDRAAVMVKDSANAVGAPNWFFMRSECLEVPPVYIGMRHFLDDPSARLLPGGEPPIRPDRVYVSASMGYYYNSAARLAWRWWGPAQTNARGIGRFNKCFPCSANRYARRRGARVVLSRRVPGLCAGTTAVFYTRARVTLPLYRGPHWLKAAGGRYHVRLVPTCG